MTDILQSFIISINYLYKKLVYPIICQYYCWNSKS